MARRLAVILCACAVALSRFVLPALPQTVQSVAAAARQSICVVLPGGGNGTTSGTGFAVADGFVLTAQHVVQHADHLRVSCPDRPAIEVTLAKTDADNDLALLQSPLLTIRPLPLADSANVQVGQEVVVMGFPRADLLGAGTATVTQGIVSSVQAGAFQFQAPVGPGNSGSPVLTLQGQVIGVVRAVLGSQMGSNFATSFATVIDAAKPFLTAARGPNSGPRVTPGPYGGVGGGTAANAASNAPSVPSVPPAAPGSSSFVITPGHGIGDLKLGMSQGDIEKLMGPAKGAGGGQINWFDHQPNGAWRGLWVVVSSRGASMIGVLNDSRYVIPMQGLHHGSSESDVRAALGEPSREEKQRNDKLLYYDSLGLRFTIASDRSSALYGLVHEIAVYKAP